MPSRIAHVSDLHFGKVDPAVLDPLLSDLAGLRPDLVVVSGDLTQRATEAQYEAAAELLRRMPAPVLAVPGNHDVSLWNVFRRFVMPLTRWRRHVSEDVEATWAGDGVFVAGLNSARSLAFKGGRISPRQLERLRKRVADAPRGSLKIAVLHHPLVLAEGANAHDVLHGADRVLDALHEIGVEVVLSGHLHRSFSRSTAEVRRAAGRTVLVVQAGSTTSTRLRGESNSFNVLDVEPEHATVTVHAYEPGRARFVPGTPLRYDKWGSWVKAAVPAQALRG